MSYILVAEDNPILADVLRFNLQRQRHEVLVAKTGIQALQYLDQRLPDVLITDYQMPGASGEAVCRHVREVICNDSLPIIVCSAKGIELNACDFIRRWKVAKLIYKPLACVT